jgi:hypothetical protein
MSAVGLPSLECWGVLAPRDAADFLSAARLPWWVAGGRALDIFLGKVTRVHKDLDIGIFRKDVASVLEFYGALTRLVEGDVPRAEINSLWCKRANAAHWELELMLDECDGEFWVLRRDARIRRLLSSAIRCNPEGITYLAPEIQLLYKARATRAKDQADFEQVVSHLTHDARTWLRESLKSIEPAHPWIPLLKDAT